MLLGPEVHCWFKIMVFTLCLMSQYQCSFSRPQFGGDYCTGERKRYRMCNISPCHKDLPTFRQMQCSEFDTVPYQNEFYHWVPVYNTGKKLQMFFMSCIESQSYMPMRNLYDGEKSLSYKFSIEFERKIWCAPMCWCAFCVNKKAVVLLYM